MTPEEIKQIADALTAALDPIRSAFESLKIDQGALRTSEPFRISPDGIPVLAVSTTLAVTDVIPEGLYHIVSDTPGVFIDIDQSPHPVVGNSYRLVADGVFGPVEIKKGERIGAIMSAGTANLYCHRVF
jgi:hypothetical protein